MTDSFHTMNVDLAQGEGEVSLVIKFRYAPGRPETPPAYSHGGLPADPPEIEFVECKGPLEGDTFDRYRQESFDTLAENYLSTDHGYNEAIVIAEEERRQ